MEYIYQKTMYGNSIAIPCHAGPPPQGVWVRALPHNTKHPHTYYAEKNANKILFAVFFLSDASTLVLNFAAAHCHTGDKKETLVKAHWRVESRSMEHWSVMIYHYTF